MLISYLVCRQTDQFADNRECSQADCEVFRNWSRYYLHWWGRLSHYCVGHESTFKTPFKYVTRHRRLRGGRHGGHTKPVTAVQFAASELVSGDLSGLIIVWDIPTAVILRKVQAHEKSVRSLHFDATEFLVGNDGLVVITDITTGDIIERFGTCFMERNFEFRL